MEFKHSLDNFRGIAILFIMIAHIQSIFTIGGYEEGLRYSLIGATIWFAFITGYLFFYLESNKFRYRDYLAKKLKNVIIPYLILSLVCLAAGIMFHRYEYLDMSIANYIAWSLVVGGSVVGPMWFIPMVTLFFLISPIIYIASKSRYVHLITLAAITFSIFSGKPSLNLNPVLSLTHYLGFYFLGISCAKEHALLDRLMAKPLPSALIIIGGLLVFILSYRLFAGYESLQEGYFEKLGKLNAIVLGKVGLLMASFVILSKYMNYKNAFLSFFAKMSFGLFFIHGFFMLAYELLGDRLHITQPAAIVIVESIFVIGFSVVTVLLVKSILGKRSRYVIGY